MIYIPFVEFDEHIFTTIDFFLLRRPYTVHAMVESRDNRSITLGTHLFDFLDWDSGNEGQQGCRECFRIWRTGTLARIEH